MTLGLDNLIDSRISVSAIVCGAGENAY
jgi:hypothetical protein